MTEKAAKKTTKKAVAKPSTKETTAVETGQEPQAVAPAAPKQGDDFGYKDGINVEDRGDKIVVSFPNRKSISYPFSDKTPLGRTGTTLGFIDDVDANKLYPKEKLQQKSVAFSKADMTPENQALLISTIRNAREFNAKLIQERDETMDYLKSIAGGKEIKISGPAMKKNELENGKSEYIPTYFTGNIIKAEKHSFAAIELVSDKCIYARIIETSRLPLTAQDYAYKEQAVKSYLGLDPSNVSKQTINGKSQEIISAGKRYFPFDENFEIPRVSPYVQKQANTQAKPQAQTKGKAQGQAM